MYPTVVQIIQLLAMLTMFVGMCCFFYNRTTTKKGIGARSIQFMAVIFLLPIIMVLALEKIIDGQTLGTLLGGLTGYILSGISYFDNNNGSSE